MCGTTTFRFACGHICRRISTLCTLASPSLPLREVRAVPCPRSRHRDDWGALLKTPCGRRECAERYRLGWRYHEVVCWKGAGPQMTGWDKEGEEMGESEKEGEKRKERKGVEEVEVRKGRGREGRGVERDVELAAGEGMSSGRNRDADRCEEMGKERRAVETKRRNCGGIGAPWRWIRMVVARYRSGMMLVLGKSKDTTGKRRSKEQDV